MKIVIEIPRWLGDSVMVTPAIENLLASYPDAKLTIFGSQVSCELFREHPNVERLIVDKSRDGGTRAAKIYSYAKSAGRFDLALSFRSHLYSRLFLFFLSSPKRYIYSRRKTAHKRGEVLHQVERYSRFVDYITGVERAAGDLKLHYRPYRYERPTLGINPGATYGSAKRWYPQRFAEAAAAMSESHDIVIFGSAQERDIAGDIALCLEERGVKNYSNLAGETDIAELCSHIAGLSLFVTADSGPMHIAAAYKIPTVAIFGPTRHRETAQWRNPDGIILRRDMDCAPCMKRECPLKTHECMKAIGAQEVVAQLQKLASRAQKR
jgi:heptosyltransferase-2